MTIFKTPAERQSWMQVRCRRIGERFQVECHRVGFNPMQIQFECTVELHKITEHPGLASNLRADWLAVAVLCGIDIQFILAGHPASDRDSPHNIETAEVPKRERGQGGQAERLAWESAHRLAIGTRLNEECARLGLDLQPYEYLCTRTAKQLKDSPREAGYIRADFLSLLADKGVDCRYVIAGVRSPNWPASA